jgi:hypothetical protein
MNCLALGGCEPTGASFGQGEPPRASENARKEPSVDPGVTEPPVVIATEMTSEQRAQGILRGFLLVIKHHNAPQAVRDSLGNQMLRYLSRDPQGGHLTEAAFVKRAKFVTCAPMSWYLKNGCEPLKEPPVVWKPTGQFWKWARRRLWDRSVKNTHLWYSWLQGKRAAHPLTDEMVLGAYEDHRVAMEQPDPINTDTLDGVMLALEPRIKVIAEMLTKAYMPATLEEHLEYYGDLDGDTRHVASTRACFEKSRAKGGQLGHLHDRYFGKTGGAPTELSDPRLDLKRMSWRPQCLVGNDVCNNVVIEHYAASGEERVWSDGLHQDALFYRGEVLKATIQVVLEPLKTRVISKGQAVPYYLSKPLQHRLHTVLRELPEFRLIGSPLQATDLMDLEDNRVVGGTGRYEWFSIDYSAATDGLSARLSAAIMERLLRSQRSDLREIWMPVLAPHFCKYPPGFDVPPVQQRNGQLMGSILSFPILCLANLGLYLYSIRDDPRPIGAKCRGVLVNGDDMLYVARRSRWATHVRNGEAVGLRMSPGKAYHDPVYANANSACYHFRLRTPVEEWADGTQVYELDLHSRTPKAIPFLNSGLYFGQNKVMEKVSDGTTIYDEQEDPHKQSKVSVIPELLRGVRPGVPARKREIYAGYLKRHKDDLAKECGDRNFFISRGLGGMGLTSDPDLRTHVTMAQRQQAFRMYKAQPNGHIGFGPLLGREVDEPPVPFTAPWLVPDAVGTEPPKYRWRRGAPALSEWLCLQPFRVCDQRRRRPAGHTMTRTVTSEWDCLDPDALTMEITPRLALEERPLRREGRTDMGRAKAAAWLDAVEWDDRESLGFETDRYHTYLDSHLWVPGSAVPGPCDWCESPSCDCNYANAAWEWSMGRRATVRATSVPDPGDDLFHEQKWD